MKWVRAHRSTCSIRAACSSQAQTNYAQSRYTYLQNVINLRLAAGNLDEQTLAESERPADGERAAQRRLSQTRRRRRRTTEAGFDPSCESHGLAAFRLQTPALTRRAFCFQGVRSNGSMSPSSLLSAPRLSSTHSLPSAPMRARSCEVRQQPGHPSPRAPSGSLHDLRSTAIHENLRDVGAVEVVRAGEHRQTECRGLEQVVPADSARACRRQMRHRPSRRNRAARPACRRAPLRDPAYAPKAASAG